MIILLAKSYKPSIEREAKNFAASQNVVWFHRYSHIPDCKMLNIVGYISAFHKKLSHLVYSSCVPGSALRRKLFGLLKIRKFLKP